MQLRIQLACLSAVVLMLQACTPPALQSNAAGARRYSTDLVGKAASCTTSPVTVKDGAPNQVAMTTGGGGWCGLGINTGGHPYSAGLLTKAPANGRVYVHAVGDETRIDYTPARAPLPDSFTVSLIPGNATIMVAVNAPGAAK